MPSHYGMNEYEHEDYDEYEEDGSDGEGEEVEERPPSQEQQEFLKSRELLKEKYRQQFKKEAAGAFGRSQSKRGATNDNFGSFFGPSQPVIASRVLDERRSIQETQHIISRVSNGSSGNAKNTAYTSSEKRTCVDKQQPKAVNEVKKKVQTLKDTRDYSFLLSGDADLPDAQEEQRPARNVPASGFGGRLDQPPPKSRPQMARPARPVPSGYGLFSPAAKTPQSHSRVGPGGGADLHRHKPATVMHRKIDNPRDGSGRSVVQKPLPSKVPAHMTGTSRPANVLKPPANVVKAPYPKSKQSVAAPYSSARKNHYMEQKRPSQSLNNIKPTANRPLPSSKSQPPKKMPPRGSHEVRLKKKSMERRLDDDEGGNAIELIRKMFRYDPSEYAEVDSGDDSSDMEADFDEINREEKRSEMIAREEDEEQARLIEDEARRETAKKAKKVKKPKLKR